MELKQYFTFLSLAVRFLLIVPYGIETPYSSPRFIRSELLIVPYGIETLLYY